MIRQIKNKLKDKKVGIAGSGGLGSNCAVALARVGVGSLVITDFDVIEESNLNRQYFFHDQIGQKKVIALENNLKRINPEVEVNAYDIKLDPENIKKVFSSCDVIIEAFDLAEMKQMIIETVLTEFPDKFIISGVGLSGFGDFESICIKKMDKLIICGDFKTEATESVPPLAPRVGIVSNMQANIVLDILLESIY